MTELNKLIVQNIKKNHGWISFADYMQAALYTKNLGYYTKLQFGHDFITAPEISALFSQTLAQAIIPQLKATPAVIEIGAGKGTMAADILLFLSANNIDINQYSIVEVSPYLQKLQQETIEKKAPHLIQYVQWLDEAPKSFSGVILANELFDALPAERFIIQNNKAYQLGVTLDENEQFAYKKSGDIKLALPQDTSCYPEGYCSELNPNADKFLHNIAAKMNQASLIIIDYGYEDFEYFHPERSNGTLKCFFEHHHHDNPFIHVGDQDISVHVRFSALAAVAEKSGLVIESFQTQAQFLLANGITQLAEKKDLNNIKTRLLTSQAIQKLTMPGQMGEVLKVMTLTKT